MKQTYIGIVAAAVAFGAASLAQAQHPQRVEDFIQKRMPHEWYAEQVELWKAEINRNPQNADAWLNYYKAKRYAGFGDTTADQAAKWQQMQDLLDSMEKAIPDSYEYHYARWWAGGNNLELFPHLQRAFELRQDYADLSDDFICYYELTGDHEKMAFFCKQWYASRELSPALLEYNYNVLMSLEPGAILVTVGDNDTYPLWILQNTKGIRTDVTVINASLINVPEYRERIMREKNVKGDGSLLDWDRMADNPYETMQAEFMKSLADSNTGRPVYFGLTCSPEYLELIKDDLYTVGLANRYSRTRIDNIALLKRNWKKFHLDYLTLDIYGESYAFNTSWLPMINMNYVTPATLLYEHYRLAGDEEQAAWYREFALRIGREGGEEKQVETYLSNLGSTEKDVPMTVTASSPLGENQDELAESLTIFPNPAYSILTVALREAMLTTVKLVSLDGRVIRTGATEERALRLDISDVPEGNYILHVVTPRGSASRMVEVKR